MRLPVLLFLSALLGACASQPATTSAGKDRIYSYVDAQGNLVQGELPPRQTQAPAPAPGDKEVPRSYSYKDAQGNLVVDALPPKAADDDYQTPEQAEAKADARDHDRFVTYYDAEGRLVREPVDPVTARAYRKEQEAQQNYQQIATEAAQQAQDRQYVETMTAIPADCCTGLLAHADKLKPGKEKSLVFANGEYGWIKLEASHPAHIYSLDDKARRLAIRSFKEKGSYLHPYLLFLDPRGTPILAVNNLFQRRYPETWYRYGYVEGSLLAPAGASYVVVYLSYETGSRETGMVPLADPALVPEPDATPAAHGELTLSASVDQAQVDKEPKAQ